MNQKIRDFVATYQVKENEINLLIAGLEPRKEDINEIREFLKNELFKTN